MRENPGLDLEDEEGLEAERKCREVLSRLAKEDKMCIELYHEIMKPWTTTLPGKMSFTI